MSPKHNPEFCIKIVHSKPNRTIFFVQTFIAPTKPKQPMLFLNNCGAIRFSLAHLHPLYFSLTGLIIVGRKGLAICNQKCRNAWNAICCVRFQVKVRSFESIYGKDKGKNKTVTTLNQANSNGL